MTGFGKYSSETTEKQIIVEVRSLNSKSLDLNVRMPYLYKEKEIELRREVAKKLERGKVDISIHIESKEAEEESLETVNQASAVQYYKELKSLSQTLNEPDMTLLTRILKRASDTKLESKKEIVFDDKEWSVIKSCVDKAIDDFQQFRGDEGKSLGVEFNKRIKNLNRLLDEVVRNDAARVQNIKKRIRKNIDEVIVKGKVDKNRFEQELIYYIEKLDITEEKVRLRTHLDYFLKTMKDSSGGRKLGFIAQEIGREINTIGSKANDATVQKCVVQMKDELEKVKEQLLNVL